jgi:hypothetical protein
MRTTKRIAIALLTLGALLAPVSQAGAAEAKPAWRLRLVALPTNLVPGSSGTRNAAPVYQLTATNIGAAAAAGPVTLSATFPAGVTPGQPEGEVRYEIPSNPTCPPPSGQSVTCTAPGPAYPSRPIAIAIPVQVSSSLQPGEVLGDVTATVSSPGTATVETPIATPIDTAPPPFGFLPGDRGLATLFTKADGSPALRAGSRPDQFTVNLGFPNEQLEFPKGPTGGAGHPRDIVTDLPRGLVINPNATPVKCTEVQFSSGLGEDGCPPASQVGVATFTTDTQGPRPEVSAVYNMQPPPGHSALFAFEPVPETGIVVHIGGGVRSDGDYGLYAESPDTLARFVSPLEELQLQLWGDPTVASHDQVRGFCRNNPKTAPCPAEQSDRPFITLPSACSQSMATIAHARSWEESEEGITALTHHASAEATDLHGNPVGVSGCSLLEFEPSLTLKPDTNAAESPAGVSVDLHVPQNPHENELATSNLKDATVTLPQGMAVNPASAGGLDACSPAQVGLITPIGQQSPIHLTNAPDNCPDAAKIGSVEVTTPLLDHPLPGGVYVATPYQNPFGTLLAIYVSIKSPADGVYAKLAGKVEADPVTGQLTTTFKENPELPVEDFKLDFFGGPRAALRTPSDCGTYSTTGSMTPWSGTPAVATSDSFQVSGGPGGGACTTSEAQRPNVPGFEAGTKTPLAGTYSPFVMNLKRADGQQLIKGLDLSLPPGLTGKLAGVSECSDAAIAAAQGKSGREELASPSCPASSQVGEVTVGAGAGSQPYYTKGTVYLGGPYKGAPLSFAIVTPAVAGPYDLGNVVVRAAVDVNPATAKITVHSDPLPTILEGIPLQMREIRVDTNRPQFTLNPTSCDPFQVTGLVTSAAGQAAALANRFQVGGCGGLDFKPNLKLAFKGGTKRTKHPALKSVLTFPKVGDFANIGRAAVTLPQSEFIDQAHIGSPCTRPQFAARTCPKISVLGKAKAWSPLLDKPLEGNVYFRSNGGERELPDIVVDLRGQIHVELVGAVDTVVSKESARIRTTFFQVPDAPVSRFELQLKGGKQGVLVNSEDLCHSKQRAVVKLTGQNNAFQKTEPKVDNQCGKKKRGGAAGKK